MPNYLALIKENDQSYKEATTLENRMAVAYAKYMPEFEGKRTSVVGAGHPERICWIKPAWISLKQWTDGKTH